MMATIFRADGAALNFFFFHSNNRCHPTNDNRLLVEVKLMNLVSSPESIRHRKLLPTAAYCCRTETWRQPNLRTIVRKTPLNTHLTEAFKYTSRCTTMLCAMSYDNPSSNFISSNVTRLSCWTISSIYLAFWYVEAFLRSLLPEMTVVISFLV